MFYNLLPYCKTILELGKNKMIEAFITIKIIMFEGYFCIVPKNSNLLLR